MTKFTLSSDRLYIDAALRLMRDAYSGNYFLEKSGRKSLHLMKFPAEPDTNYEDRLARSVFYNFTKSLIRIAAEKPFSANPTFSDDFPEQLEFAKAFFGAGVGVFGFSQKTFLSGILKGQTGILADYNPETGQPFCKIIPPENILGVYFDKASSNKRIKRVQFFLEDSRLEDQGFSGDGGKVSPTDFTEVRGKRVFDLEFPNIVRIYDVQEEEFIKQNTEKDSGGLLHDYLRLKPPLSMTGNLIEEKRLVGFEKLPFYLFQAEAPENEDCPFMVTPPFYDLAKLNFSHFNKISDQDNIMRVSRYALLCMSGVPETEAEALAKSPNKGIGPFSFLVFSDPNARVYYAEHSGKAINEGRNDILQLEKTMLSNLSDYLSRQTLIETATEKNIDEKNKNLYVVGLAKKLENIISECLKDFARYLSVNIPETENLVSFAQDYDPSSNEKKIEAIIKARMMGDLTIETFLKELSALSVFSSNFDADAETEKIEEEAALAPPPPAPPNPPTPADNPPPAPPTDPRGES